MATYKLTLEYDGTAYAGWQRQPDQPTIQGAVEAALQRLTQAPVTVIGAGRTDAGTHAIGQVASFRSDKGLSPEEWNRALDALLPPDISVRAVERVPDTFHARYSARWKLYEYRILQTPWRSALDRHRVWHVRAALDVQSMRKAAATLLGRHDFSSFQGSPTDTDDPICDLRRLDLVTEPPLLRFEVEADRFLKQMVRSIVGTLVEVGRGKRAAASLQEILDAKDRRAAGYTAPAHGLYLVHVEYGGGL